MKYINNKSALVFLALSLFIIQPFYTWFSADDYCLIGKVQAEGMISNMFHDYLEWDGRSISLTYPVCRIGLYIGVSWLGPLIGSFMMIAMAVLILKLTDLGRLELSKSILAIITLTILLWLVFFNFLSQTLYWTTGVGYNMDIVMLLAAIWWISRWQSRTKDYLIGLPLFFYSGTCSPNGVLALLFLLGIQWLYGLLIMQRKEHLKYAYALVLIITAMALVIFSPGNKNRMTAWDWNNLTHFWTVYFNIKLLIRNLFNYNSVFVWPLIAFGLVGATLQLSTVNLQPKGIIKTCLNFLFFHRYLIAALISFFFFLPLPGMNSPRTAIQFAAFSSLYGLSYVTYLYGHFQDLKGKLALFCTVLIHLVFIFVAGSQIFDARYVKTQMAQRDSKLKALRGQHVKLTEADYVRTPATRRFEDLSSDSSYWLNECVAAHYGLKSIKMVDNRPKKVVTGVFTD